MASDKKVSQINILFLHKMYILKMSWNFEHFIPYFYVLNFAFYAFVS